MFKPDNLKLRDVTSVSVMLVFVMLILLGDVLADIMTGASQGRQDIEVQVSTASAISGQVHQLVANKIQGTQDNKQTGASTGGRIDQDASNKAKVIQDNAQTGTATGGRVDQDAANKAKVAQANTQT